MKMKIKIKRSGRWDMGKLGRPLAMQGAATFIKSGLPILFFRFRQGETGGRFHATLFDIDGDTLIREFLHNNFRIESLRHHHTPFLDPAFSQEAADEGRR
jgi:hypothetical protein